jgi:hypothetical protein
MANQGEWESGGGGGTISSLLPRGDVQLCFGHIDASAALNRMDNIQELFNAPSHNWLAVFFASTGRWQTGRLS